MRLEQLLAELADETKPVRHAALSDMSDVAGEELEVMKDGWPKVPAPRRTEVVAKLLDLTEDNPELNFNAIFALCLRDEHDQVREKAIAGLWESEERSLASSFIRMLQCDPSPNVREAAAQALGRYVDLSGDGKLSMRDHKRIEDALLAAATSAEQPIAARLRALEACAAIHAPQVIALISDTYASPNPKSRASALFAMGRNGDPQWQPVILKELGSPLPAMRYEAAAACGQLGEANLAPKLLPLLRDNDLQVRLAAIGALGAIGGLLARKALQAVLNDPDQTVRDAAEEALDHLQLLQDPLSFRPLR
ncbi:MAG: phycocyanin alpha phycocyanobilin lyase [Dehalococcoidia bacterium]|nr:phycocyanin alpha phycocyanobilin lyase [Dehalococcoidia bacterium]